MTRIRTLAAPMEFLEAGSTEGDKMQARILAAEIDRLYVSWGLQAVSGFTIDGVAASAASLADAGPEELFLEALAMVKAECGLSEQERKN